MKWSARDQKTATALRAIDRARRMAAELRLHDAHQSEDEARSGRDSAEAELQASATRWSEHLRSGRFDLALSQALAGGVVEQERAVERASTLHTESEALVERRRLEWRDFEASVQSGESLLNRGRRAIARRAEESRAAEISESTTWKWFKR